MNIFGSIKDVREVVKYQPCPVYKKGKPWQLGEEISDLCIKNACGYLDREIKAITASDFMSFFKTGDRSVFEGEHFKRRSALGSMMLAECVEAKGRFVGKIIDTAWMICEESFWGLPATMSKKNGFDILPDDTTPDLELFACETGSLLSYLIYIMGDAFDEVSPLLRKRIEREIKKRIIEPFLSRDDFTWMGLGGDTGELWKLSNWTPWCYSNCLSALLLVEKDEEKQIAGIKKVMTGLGRFLTEYRTDGGCDEGCGYWSRSAGSVFDCLEMLSETVGTDIYSLPIVRNMGKYIVDCYIGNGYFVNFADAGARIIPEAELVFRYGERTGNERMQMLGREFIDTYLEKRYYVISQSPMRLIPTVINYEKVKSYIGDSVFNKEGHYDITQICMLRPSKEWFIAAKGGHNNETHNHNDVGSFVLFYDNKPVFIDAGVEKYSAKTFGEHRYELWTMQSDYHNLPKINGFSQPHGCQYRADAFYVTDNQIICEIQSAYPKEAGVRLWRRRMFEKNGSVFLCEEIVLERASVYEMAFMTPIKPIIEEAEVILNELILSYDNSLLCAEYEEIELNDEGLKNVWGTLYRLCLRNRSKVREAQLVLEIKKRGEKQ